MNAAHHTDQQIAFRRFLKYAVAHQVTVVVIEVPKHGNPPPPRPLLNDDGSVEQSSDTASELEHCQVFPSPSVITIVNFLTDGNVELISSVIRHVPHELVKS